MLHVQFGKDFFHVCAHFELPAEYHEGKSIHSGRLAVTYCAVTYCTVNCKDDHVASSRVGSNCYAVRTAFWETQAGAETGAGHAGAGWGALQGYDPQ